LATGQRYGQEPGTPEEIKAAQIGARLMGRQADKVSDDLASAGNPRDYTVAATNPDGTNTVIAQVTHDSIGY